MNIKDVQFILKNKGFNHFLKKGDMYYYEIFIYKNNKRYNIQFFIRALTKDIVTVQNLELCDCVVDCCGERFDNFIFESEEQFEDVIKKYIEDYES